MEGKFRIYREDIYLNFNIFKSAKEVRICIKGYFKFIRKIINKSPFNIFS